MDILEHPLSASTAEALQRFNGALLEHDAVRNGLVVEGRGYTRGKA
jgi:hypothetical protein